MSVTIMAQIWPLEMRTTEKLVLLALADAANDAGVTWIAVKSRKRGEGKPKLDLARKCSLSERAIQGAIIRLCQSGHLKRVETPGKGCTYTVHPTPTPAADAPPQQMRPADAAPPQQTTPTPAADAGKPSVTVIVDDWEARAREILRSPEWRAFGAMRRQIRKPLNPTGEKRILARLKALAEAGYPPGEVLEQSTANCWRGVFEIRDEANDNRRTNGVGRHQPGDGLSATRRAALRVFGAPGAGEPRPVPG